MDKQRPKTGFPKDWGQQLVDNLNRHVTAEAVLDAFAHRRGERFGPELRRENLADEFVARFRTAYEAKPKALSAEQFAREFVDAWPAGVPHLVDDLNRNALKGTPTPYVNETVPRP